MKKMQSDLLQVEIYETRAEMGLAAGKLAAKHIRECLHRKGCANVIFAAAPSQNEMLQALIREPGIDWSRVNAFHMDEYIGLSNDAPQRFGNFLKARIFDRLSFRSVNYIDCSAEDIASECARYTDLLRRFPVDIVLLGIGENGHIAFNDPPVADFEDPCFIKAVALDPVCRQQQVNDGCFASLALVPKFALTLTVPALMAAEHLVCTVPAATKAWAVKQTVTAPIGVHCPATVMRRHKSAVLLCDRDSGGGLL